MRLHDPFHHGVHTLGDFCEHRVCADEEDFVEPIEKVVVDGVDEKLTPAGVFGAGICHRQSPRLVRDLKRRIRSGYPSLASLVISSFVADA